MCKVKTEFVFNRNLEVALWISSGWWRRKKKIYRRFCTRVLDRPTCTHVLHDRMRGRGCTGISKLRRSSNSRKRHISSHRRKYHKDEYSGAWWLVVRVVISHRNRRCASSRNFQSRISRLTRQTQDRYRTSWARPRCCRTSSICRTTSDEDRNQSRRDIWNSPALSFLKKKGKH